MLELLLLLGFVVACWLVFALIGLALKLCFGIVGGVLSLVGGFIGVLLTGAIALALVPVAIGLLLWMAAPLLGLVIVAAIVRHCVRASRAGPIAGRVYPRGL